MHQGLEYWQRFKSEFLSALSQEESGLAEAWSNSTKRTEFYRDRLLPKVANALALELRPELFRRDFAMRAKATNGHSVPLIFIESENQAETAEYEIGKLCAVCAPLRVLITATTWDESPGIRPLGGHRTAYINSWGKIINAHGEVWPQPGIIGVIVGERREKAGKFYLKFHAFAFDPQGNRCEPETVLFHRDMGQQAPPQLDQGSFFEKLRTSCQPAEVDVAKQIVALADELGLTLCWMGPNSRVFMPLLGTSGFWPLSLDTSGRLTIPMHRLAQHQPFNEATKRSELQERVRKIPGVKVVDGSLAGPVSIPLSALVQNAPRTLLLGIVKWLIDEIKQSAMRALKRPEHESETLGLFTPNETGSDATIKVEGESAKADPTAAPAWPRD